MEHKGSNPAPIYIPLLGRKQPRLMKSHKGHEAPGGKKLFWSALTPERVMLVQGFSCLMQGRIGPLKGIGFMLLECQTAEAARRLHQSCSHPRRTLCEAHSMSAPKSASWFNTQR